MDFLLDWSFPLRRLNVLGINAIGAPDPPGPVSGIEGKGNDVSGRRFGAGKEKGTLDYGASDTGSKASVIQSAGYKAFTVKVSPTRVYSRVNSKEHTVISTARQLLVTNMCT